MRTDPRLPRNHTRQAIAAITLALIAGSMPGAVMAAEEKQRELGVPNPIVEGPIGGGVRGRPWFTSLVDVRPYGYSEEEFFFTGIATHLATGTQAPYRSRMLVRRPVDPDHFNGTVIVEWLNVTGQYEVESLWPVTYEYLMEEGYAYVGVSAQMVGICCGPNSLKGWDPVRYGSLAHPGDSFSFEIYSQAVEALRDPRNNGTTPASPQVVDPMGGLGAEHLVANGASQSARGLTSYINDGYHEQAGVIDGFVITRGGGPFPKKFDTPIFQLNEEGLVEHRRDNDHFVLWEEAGTAHVPAPWWNYMWKVQMRENGLPWGPDAVNIACSMNRGRVDYSARALMFHMQRWLEAGITPPSAPRIARTKDGEIKRDDNGLAIGGIRHPFVEVPIALNDNSVCPNFGHYEAWSAEKIRELYPTRADYVSKVAAWAGYEVARGWVLPLDAADARAEAAAVDVWD